MSQYPLFCECIPGKFDMSGGAEVIEEGGTAPSTIIGTNQKWKVRFDWKQWGHLCTHFSANCYWNIHLYLHPWEGLYSPNWTHELTVQYEKVDGHEYKNKELEVKAGAVPVGVYRLGAVVQLYDEMKKPMPILGYIDGPFLQFFNP